ncbi:hypothetical protein HPP92_008174 [Vanilla planifolia]|uniref:Uncharacterized protein n=1 Tax=Vanilla planifolia TaxID=51239 RepID=A0A835R2A8_VANPL|nr:hypothetical protein HPP92_008330 [Vanilla planifolia]KAG0486079.1 hypothetical protein HPP92_008174 [Vanilla planifolia]
MAMPSPCWNFKLIPSKKGKVSHRKFCKATPSPTLIRSKVGNIDLSSESIGDGGIISQLSHSSQPSLMAASRVVASVTLPPKRSKKNVSLFFCEETRDLAERVAMESDAIELRSINWRTFEDGFPNLFIPNAHGIRGQHVAFLASFSSPGETRDLAERVAMESDAIELRSINWRTFEDGFPNLFIPNAHGIVDSMLPFWPPLVLLE